MTLIAGIFSRNNQPVSDSACASLRDLISRDPSDEVVAFRDRRGYFAKVDIGAFGEPGAISDPSGALSLLAGEPLLAGREAECSSRQHDLAAIHEQCLKNNWDVLREANGTFSMVHYQPQSGSVSLITDKLGLRPMYLWVDERLVVFASALRILERFPLVPKKMDLRAVTEIAGLSAPLGYRTPYDGISLLRPGELVQVKNEKISRRYYWRWDEAQVANESEPVRLKTVYGRFQEAVTRRMRNDRTTAAYLSGGLDSRCIVAALRHQGVQVHTWNFARPGTQDYNFGNDFAQMIGSIHEAQPKKQGDSVPDYSALMAKAWGESEHRRQWPAERSQLVWSGEGGSLLLGLVSLSESIVNSLRAGDVDGAIEEYLKITSVHIPHKLFRPEVSENIGAVIKQGMREELKEFHAEDAGRNFYVFLIHNDQHRKLANHFENIDLHRLEFQLPFFDAAFLEAVITTPLDTCLRHKFYTKWLSHFPAAVVSVPWQTYPGHEPCPLSVSPELAYQWDDNYQAREQVSKRQSASRQASELLRSADFPDKILSRRNLRLAAWIHATGWRDYSYAIEAAKTYHAYSRKCGGEFTFSPV